jgi:8-oxo-dGTP diphosphatase
MYASMPSTAAETGVLHVAVAAIVNARQEVLLSLRPEHVHQGGLWEFPGGKLEDGESVSQALAREIHEDLGVLVSASRPLIRVHHRYPERQVLLDVWRVTAFTGKPHGREGQLVEWVPVEQLATRAFPVANRPIVQALQLPSTYLITPEPGSRQEVFLESLEAALAGGIQLVQLRAPGLALPDYTRLARSVVDLCHHHRARVLLNADAALVQELHADGLHINSQRLAQCSARPLPDAFTVIASCHNEQQLLQAQRIAVDAAVLSPVRPTASHPGAETLGWSRFGQWVERCPFPVYALGGMSGDDIATAQAHGGQGIAAIRALWPAR